MQKQPVIIDASTDTDYLNAHGPIDYRFTNDYIFRIVFQENKFALKGLLASLLHIDPDTILDLKIENEIVPGVSISDKEYRFDILATMNDNTLVDIEMQLNNLGNWQYRSLCYLCREFDSIKHGDDYDQVKPVYQIGLIDFTLFKDHPEFCAKYQMRNVKDGYQYTDKFNLIVVELKHENLATEDDIAFGIDKWVRLFKAKTWEELRMIAQDNKYLESAVRSAYLSNSDKNIRKIARERDDFLRMEAAREKKLAHLSEENAALTNKNTSLTKENASLANENASLANEVSSLTNEITRLKKLLQDNNVEA